MKWKFTLCTCILGIHTSIAQTITWQALETGLELAEIPSPVRSTSGDQLITVLRIDPKLYDLELASAKQPGEKPRTAEDWAKHRGFIAVVNAGMYLTDMRTNVGYMELHGFVNNPRMNKDNAIVAFDRKDTTVVRFQILDVPTQDVASLKGRYECLTQGIRMVDTAQRNKWAQENRKWSTACIAADKQGRALLDLPLDIYNMMYLEGGPEASFYLKHGGVERRKFGSFETGFNENEDNDRFWEIPNVIGIRKR
jgi:hypothetical protein